MNHHDLLDSHDLRVSTPQQVCDQKTIPRCHFPSHTRRWQLGAVVCQFGDMRIDETSEKMQDWGSDFLKEVSKEVFLWKYKDPMSPFIGYTYIYMCVFGGFKVVLFMAGIDPSWLRLFFKLVHVKVPCSMIFEEHPRYFAVASWCFCEKQRCCWTFHLAVTDL